MLKGNNMSCILACEANLLLKNLGINFDDIDAFIAKYEVTIPLKDFMEEYTASFFKASYFGRWQAKEHYLNLSKDQLAQGIAAASKRNRP